MDELIDNGEKIVSKAYSKQTSKLPKGVRRRVDSVRAVSYTHLTSGTVWVKTTLRLGRDVESLASVAQS